MKLTACCFLLLWTLGILKEEASAQGRNEGVARTHLERGLEKMQAGDLYQAKNEFNYVIGMPDQDIQAAKSMAYLNLGVINFMEGNLERAVRNYQTAIQINPDYTEAHFNLGGVYYKQGLLKKAEGAFLRAIELEPDYGRAHYSLGNVYFDQKRYDLARKEAELANEYGVAYTTLKEKLAKIK